MQNYLGVLFTFIFSGLLTGIMVFLASTLGQKPAKVTPAKYIPYETGKIPFSLPGKIRFPVHFYVIAMIFIIFDVELAFLFPWAVLFRELGWLGFVEILFFVFFILLAYAYAWKNKTMDVV